MGGPLPSGGPDQQLINFDHAVLTLERTFRNHKFRGLKVTTTKKKGRQLLGEKGSQLFGEEMSTDRENPGYVRV